MGGDWGSFSNMLGGLLGGLSNGLNSFGVQAKNTMGDIFGGMSGLKQGPSDLPGLNLFEDTTKQGGQDNLFGGIFGKLLDPDYMNAGAGLFGVYNDYRQQQMLQKYLKEAQNMNKLNFNNNVNATNYNMSTDARNRSQQVKDKIVYDQNGMPRLESTPYTNSRVPTAEETMSKYGMQNYG